MAKIGMFIDYAKAQVNKSIYVWGAQGQLLKDINPDWIKKKEDSSANALRAIKMYEKRKDVPGARAFDCSGLVCWSLIGCGAEPKGFDKSANGLMGMCTKVSKTSLRDGDLCFKVRDGKAHHVGIYFDGRVIESKGRDYGVVMNPISGWSAYGRLNIKWENDSFVLTRVLRKGDKGDDVKWVQEALIKKGYRLPKYGADGDFGVETLKAVKMFQRNNGLEDDGAVGRLTITALGGRWK